MPLKPPGPVGDLVQQYSIYSGVDHLGAVSKVDLALFAQMGRCWRMVYENRSARPDSSWSRCLQVEVEVSSWLDEGMERRAGRRRTGAS